jgi:hypothetical protein
VPETWQLADARHCLPATATKPTYACGIQHEQPPSVVSYVDLEQRFTKSIYLLLPWQCTTYNLLLKYMYMPSCVHDAAATLQGKCASLIHHSWPLTLLLQLHFDLSADWSNAA